MRGGKPDRVPCSPDFSNMIPCRLTGKPFWDIYLHDNPPLWKAYLAAADHFGIDAWFFNGSLDFQHNGPQVQHENRIISTDAERIVQHTKIITPDGDMECENTFYVADPPSPTEKPVKDLDKDFKKLRYFFRAPDSYKTDTALRQKKEVGDKHAFGTCVGYPGFHIWSVWTQGGLEPLAYAEMDCPELLEEMRELQHKQEIRRMEMILDSKLFDYVLLGASGSITLASPELFDKYAMPTIKELTRMAKQAGVLTMIHSCGKETYLVKRCAEETDLNCVNPLEIPPMGDCNLADLKKLYGKKLCLMGNIHTTEVMLKGSVQDVERIARKCVDDAAAGGGFILSTGDQCGRDTPDANIRKLVDVCETYGRYDQ